MMTEMLIKAILAPWYAEPVWSFVGVVAQIVSLLAIAFAVYELVSRGWRVRGSAITVNAWATANEVDTGQKIHIVQIINIGGAPALLTAILVVNGEIVPHTDYRVRYWLAPGESMDVPVKADDPEKVWFRFQWVSPSDRRFTFGSWDVLIRGTELSKEWTDSYDRTRGRRWFLAPFAGYFAPRIGPGAQCRTQVRVTRNMTGSQTRVERVFGPVDNATVWLFRNMGEAQ